MDEYARTYEPGSIHKVVLTGNVPWMIPAHFLVLTVERISGTADRVTGIISDGPNALRAKHTIRVRGDMYIQGYGWDFTSSGTPRGLDTGHAFRLGERIGNYEHAQPLSDLAQQVTEEIDHACGPIGDGPLGEEAAAALRDAAYRASVAEQKAEEYTGDRDDLIRRMLAGGVRVEALASMAELHRQRIYQIRDRRR